MTPDRQLPPPPPPKGFTIPEGFQIPEGFGIAHIGPDRQPALIPFYMMPSAQAIFESERAKKKPEIQQASPMVRI